MEIEILGNGNLRRELKLHVVHYRPYILPTVAYDLILDLVSQSSDFERINSLCNTHLIHACTISIDECSGSYQKYNMTQPLAGGVRVYSALPVSSMLANYSLGL